MSKIPIYDITIDLNDDETMMSCISLVTDPAVETSFLAFDKDKKQMNFAVTDTDKHCITGVAIRAGVLIYRYSPDLGEYYVRFSKETIEDIVFKYSKMNLWNCVSLEHSGKNITDAVMVEYFIKGNGKNPQGFENIEDGSLFVTYKITDDDLWNTIKNTDVINGFSIEIMSDLEPTEEYVEDDYEMNPEVEDWLMELLAWLEDEDMEIVMSSQKKKLVFDYITSGTIKDILADKASVYDVELNNGKHMICQIFAITNNGDSFEVMTADKPDGKNTWHNIQNSDVNKITKTGYPYLPFDYETPSYKAYINDKSITTNQTITAPVATIDDCIDNRRLVIINYNDDLENPHTQARQCAILAHGLTKLGNECVRVRELYGDSRSVAEGVEGAEVPGYRLMLTKRIRQMRVVDYAKPWDDSILDGDYNYSGDDGMEIIYNYYKG